MIGVVGATYINTCITSTGSVAMKCMGGELFLLLSKVSRSLPPPFQMIHFLNGWCIMLV